ncbi:hypothetical protein HD806DRAFT_551445 [Xylariaceae sp. AK1471]|nr:hypothetical protein HD806DRAFT_551445 [Xylariaceae sp. AK1471]
MASDAATESIADRVAQSLAAFEAIDMVGTQAEPGDSQFIWVQTINDQLSKFKLWAGNIGAHRTGRSSLDYRLRDSSLLHTQVLRLLDYLITSLNEVHSILSGETLPWDQDSGETGELDEDLKDLLMNEDFEFDSELGQLTKEIADAISNLLRLSISLRNPAPHDRFMSTEYANVRYFEANDKAHVEAKFPKASQTLIVRLGQALSQRRQYFRYRESHHEKLARGLFDSGRSEAGAQSTVASSVPLALRGPEAVPVFGELNEDERSDTGFSQTSFATTAPDSERPRIPPLPKRSYDGPFECPFCFMLISVSSTYQWKKHVLRDLRPYICLAEDCPAASREYSRRHDGQIRSLSPSSPVDCPLCQDILESVQQYQRHVGRHQVDLALFALPKIEDDDEELDERNEDHEDQQTISTRSGSYSEAISDDISPTVLALQVAARGGHLEVVNRLLEVNANPNAAAEHGPTALQAAAEPAEIIDGIHEEEQEGEAGLSELKPLEDNWAERQDSELFVDELNDGKIGVKYLDSREEPAHPLLTAEPVIINNRIYNLSESESETDGDENRASRGREPEQRELNASTLHHKQKRYEAEIREAAQKEYELDRAQNELEELKLVAKIDHEEKRRERTAREERELREAKKELDAIREKKDRDELERRIKQKLELDRLKEEEASLAEKRHREKEAKEAVEKYKKKEAERVLKEKEETEEREREYKHRMREQFLKSGLNEKEINAVLGGEGYQIEEEKENEKQQQQPGYREMPRPTYSRMARKHLSLETLRVYDIDYVLDQDPEYLLIKRWVPESEQDILWKHTRIVREQRARETHPSTDDSKKKSYHRSHLKPSSTVKWRKSPSL